MHDEIYQGRGEKRGEKRKEKEEELEKKEGRAVVEHAFNPNTWEAESGRFLSSRPAPPTRPSDEPSMSCPLPSNSSFCLARGQGGGRRVRRSVISAKLGNSGKECFNDRNAPIAKDMTDLE